MSKNYDNENQSNNASIQKLDAIKAIREQIPFTPLPNRVLQQLKEPLALAIWCYLQSLPPYWNVIKEQIAKHFDIGENKCKFIFALLNKCKLIEYKRIRNDKGELGEVVLIIKNGDEFQNNFSKKNTDRPIKSTTGMKIIPVDSTIGMKTRRVDIQTSGFCGIINTNKYINTIQDKNTNNSSSFFDDYQKEQILIKRRESKNLMEIEDEEFLKICEIHVKTDTPKNLNYNKPSRIHGLIKLIVAGTFEPPMSYSKTKEKIIAKQENNKVEEYQEYASRIKSDINLGLKPKNTVILNYEEWLKKQFDSILN